MVISWMFIFGILVAIFLGVMTFICLYITTTRRKYSHIPGPPADSFLLGMVPTFRRYIKDGKFFNILCFDCFFLGIIPTFKKYIKEGKFFNMMNLDWCKKYGNVYKLEFMHQTFIFTADPEAIRELMITGNHRKSKAMYDPLGTLFKERFLGKGLVIETDPKVWVWRRALMNPCFQKSFVRGFETALNSEIDLLMTRLAGIADGKTTVSMLEEFNHLTLDIIGKIAFGMEMNNVENRTEKSEFTEAIILTFKGISESLRDPFIQFKMSQWKFIREVRKALRFLRVFSRQCFNDRMAALQRGDYTPDDILNHLVKMKLENPEVDEEVILDDITTFFVAGQETTANLLSFAMMCLWQNKDVLQRLRKEVNNVVGVKSFIKMDDVNKMTYLDMVIKETLRLYPPAPNTFREAMHEIDILGYKIPVGTHVMMSTYVSSRLEEFFPDPLKFDPERFNPEAESKIPSYTYFPFTLGPRTCIGKNFAEVKAKIILAKIMQRFNFELDPDQSFEIEERATLKPKGGVMCTLTLCESVET